MTTDLKELIQQRLEAEFAPLELSIRDDSAKHAGHAGNTGGGHFAVRICSQAFEGKSLLERHRMVYAALGDLMGRIHALELYAEDVGPRPQPTNSHILHKPKKNT